MKLRPRCDPTVSPCQSSALQQLPPHCCCCHLISAVARQVEVRVPLPASAAQRPSIRTEFKSCSLSVALGDGTVLLEGQLSEMVCADGCLWEIERDGLGVHVLVTLEKSRQGSTWGRLFLPSTADSILEEGGRSAVISDADADGSSCVCNKCGALVAVKRKEAHDEFWCTAGAECSDKINTV